MRGLLNLTAECQETCPALILITHKDRAPVLDDVHSFVLRVSLNRAHGGEGRPRPQFHLEHVNDQSSSRLQSMEEVCSQLEARVTAIFDEFGLKDRSCRND